jgi:iron(III) transport system ATP-binding protein
MPETVASAIEIVGLRKRFGSVVALDGVDLRLGRGEIVAILGPSGCGKSTLLSLIAGLDGPDAGVISLEGVVMSAPGRVVAPQRRGVGLVFQDHALFPHLDVAANVAYGLTGTDRVRRAQRVTSMLELVRGEHLAKRRVHELSGGESQRVALARSLAPQPTAVLLDEPFASLDPELRGGLRRDVAEVLRRSGVAAVFVTHDAADALAVADRIVAMRAGHVVQDATPSVMLRAPADEGVARAFGPIAVGDVDPTTATVRLGDIVVGSNGGSASLPPERVLRWGDRHVVVLRPHQLVVRVSDNGRARVRSVTATARGEQCAVSVPGVADAVSVEVGADEVAPGDHVDLHMRMD